MNKLGLCIGCWHDKEYNNAKIKKEKLSRKKKKKLKKFYYLISRIRTHSMLWDTLDITSCCIKQDWIKYKRIFYKYNLFNKCKDAIEFLSKINNFDYRDSEFSFDNHLSFVWYWEDYNGLYSYDGLMKFIYDSNRKDDTWSYDETKSLIGFLGLENIKNDDHFLMSLQKKIDSDINYKSKILLNYQ